MPGRGRGGDVHPARARALLLATRRRGRAALQGTTTDHVVGPPGTRAGQCAHHSLLVHCALGNSAGSPLLWCALLVLEYSRVLGGGTTMDRKSAGVATGERENRLTRQ